MVDEEHPENCDLAIVRSPKSVALPVVVIVTLLITFVGEPRPPANKPIGAGTGVTLPLAALNGPGP
jgi:hypothetical protein